LAQCEFCGKSKQFGNYIRHPHSIGWALRAPRKNRTFSPNVHKTKVMINGSMRSVHICTRCQRTMQKV
jgi:large subunit ribosomal protein L28